MTLDGISDSNGIRVESLLSRPWKHGMQIHSTVGNVLCAESLLSCSLWVWFNVGKDVLPLI